MAALELIEQPGGRVWAADAPDWTNPKWGTHGVDPLKIGITPDAIQTFAGRGLRHMVGQMFGVVGPGLIFTQNVFKGLNRGMLVRDDNRADMKKLALTWTPLRDAKFSGDPFAGQLEYSPAPKNRVFAVYVSPNEMVEDFPLILGRTLGLDRR